MTGTLSGRFSAWNCRLAGLVVWLCIFLALAIPARAQVTFPGAEPIAGGQVAVRLQPMLTESTMGGQSYDGRTILQFGATPLLFLQAETGLPNSNSINDPATGGSRSQTATGIGDTTLVARYTVYHQDGIGTSFRIAPLVGVTTPTGMDDANGQAARALQPGTGNWGTRGGLVVQYLTLDTTTAAEIEYRANFPGAGYQFGNTFVANAGFHYKLWPSHFAPGKIDQFDLALETNYSIAGRDLGGGRTVPGTGRTLWLIDPGVMFMTPRWAIAALALLPIDEQVPHGGARFRYGAEMAFRFNFYTPHHF